MKGEAGTQSIALGMWDDRYVIGLWWNGHEENLIGNPQSRGIPTWYIVDEGVYTDAIIEALPTKMKEMARLFIKPTLVTPAS